jgi:hypothetical protein
MLAFQSICVYKVKFNNLRFWIWIGGISNAYDGINLSCIALQENMIFQNFDLTKMSTLTKGDGHFD